MTLQVSGVLESLWDGAGKPEEGWAWPTATRSGHLEPSTLRKQHAEALETLAAQAEENGERPVRPSVLYSLRHTFLTRLGQSGCDVWTLVRIAGHSSIAISARYVHPSEDAVLAVVERLGGRKNGHSQSEDPQLPVASEAANTIH